MIPFVFGAVAGVVLSSNAAGHRAVQLSATVGGFLAGTEHGSAGSGAGRGVRAGALFGLGILVAHVVTRRDATVSLGAFPPLLIVVTAAAGSVLTALGAIAIVAAAPASHK